MLGLLDGCNHKLIKTFVIISSLKFTSSIEIFRSFNPYITIQKQIIPKH